MARKDILYGFVGNALSEWPRRDDVPMALADARSSGRPEGLGEDAVRLASRPAVPAREVRTCVLIFITLGAVAVATVLCWHAATGIWIGDDALRCDGALCLTAPIHGEAALTLFDTLVSVILAFLRNGADPEFLLEDLTVSAIAGGVFRPWRGEG